MFHAKAQRGRKDAKNTQILLSAFASSLCLCVKTVLYSLTKDILRVIINFWSSAPPVWPARSSVHFPCPPKQVNEVAVHYRQKEALRGCERRQWSILWPTRPPILPQE